MDVVSANTFYQNRIKNHDIDVYTGNPKDEINIIVGDDKQSDKFYPQVKLQRWSNETNLSLRLVDTENGDEIVTTDIDKIKWSHGNIDIEYYEDASSEIGYKMVWYLKKKPKTNKIEFTLQSKGLNFFYQPPLTQEYQNGYSEGFKKEIVVTETQVRDGEGNILVKRAENVVGSYAVYHQTKGMMNDVNGKDYKVGKAFHIFRPHIVDAKGAETWGILKIENGIYSVEIPQEFLDKAVYPIKSNDTFGYTTIGTGGYDAGISHHAIMSSKDTFSPSSDGTLNSMSFYAYQGWSPASYTQLGVYNGTTLVDNTTSIYVNSATKQWWTANVSGASVSSANSYRVAFHTDENWDTAVSYDVASDYSQFNDPGSFPSWPSPISWTNYANKRLFSIYATYTPASTTVIKDLIMPGIIAFPR